MTAEEAMEMLRSKTDGELLHFRQTCRNMGTPRSFEMRLYIVKVMLERHPHMAKVAAQEKEERFWLRNQRARLSAPRL
jgi:hypothetical protein